MDRRCLRRPAVRPGLPRRRADHRPRRRRLRHEHRMVLMPCQRPRQRPQSAQTQHVRKSEASAIAQAARPDRGQSPTLTSGASGLAVQELDQSCLRTQNPFSLLRRKRREEVGQDSLPRDIHHVAGVDPASGTPGESDAPLEHRGVGRMEAVQVRTDGRSAGDADVSIAVGNRVPVPDLSPMLSPGRCSSSRHTEHSRPQRSAQHSLRARLPSTTDRNQLFVTSRNPCLNPIPAPPTLKDMVGGLPRRVVAQRRFGRQHGAAVAPCAAVGTTGGEAVTDVPGAERV